MARNKPGEKSRNYGREILADEYQDVAQRGLSSMAGITTGMAASEGLSAKQAAEMAKEVQKNKSYADMVQQHLDLLKSKGAPKNDWLHIQSPTEPYGHSKTSIRLGTDTVGKRLAQNKAIYYGSKVASELVNRAKYIPAAVAAVGMGKAMRSLKQSEDSINQSKEKIDVAKAKNAQLQSKRKRGK